MVIEIGKKSIFNSAFIKAQKSMDISKIKETIKSNLHSIQNDKENYDENNIQQVEHLMDLFTQIWKLRENEVALLVSECENFYMIKKFELAKIILGFAETIITTSGLHNWKERITVLNQKISRSLDIVEKFNQYLSLDLKIVPVIQIQQIYHQLQLVFQEIEEEKNRQDSIHPEIKQDFTRLIEKIKKFMDTNGIHPFSLEDKKLLKLWGNTKQTLDIRNKEAKLHRYISNAKKELQIKPSPNVYHAKEELMKAYKLIQENSWAFSLNQKQQVIEQLNFVEKQTNLESKKIPQIIDQIEKKCQNFKFEQALKILEQHEIRLNSMGMKIDDADFAGIRKRINDNIIIFNEFQKIEDLLEKNDLLGLKTQIIPFSNKYSRIKNTIQIYPNLQKRIEFLINTLQNNQNLSDRSQQEPFNPLFDEKRIISSQNFSKPSISTSKKSAKRAKRAESINSSTLQKSSKFKPAKTAKTSTESKMREPKNNQNSIESSYDDNFMSRKNKFEQLIRKYGQISKSELSSKLNLPQDELLPFLMECRKMLDFSVRNSLIIAKSFLNHDGSIQKEPENGKKTISNPFEEIHVGESKKLRNEKSEKSEDDLLDTLDNLLNEDL